MNPTFHGKIQDSFNVIPVYLEKLKLKWECPPVKPLSSD